MRPRLIGSAVLGALLAGLGEPAPTPAAACGPCDCDSGEPYVHRPLLRDMPLNARIFVRPGGTPLSELALRTGGADVPVRMEPAGDSPDDGVWLVPEESLLPSTTYYVGESSFETGDADDVVAPLIAAATITAGGVLPAVCGEKVGAEIQITSAEPEPSDYLVELEIVSETERAVVLAPAYGGVAAFGHSSEDSSCMGYRDAPFVREGESYTVTARMFDRAGSPSPPVVLEEVIAERIAAPGCPDTSGSTGSGGC